MAQKTIDLPLGAVQDLSEVLDDDGSVLLSAGDSFRVQNRSFIEVFISESDAAPTDDSGYSIPPSWLAYGVMPTSGSVYVYAPGGAKIVVGVGP